MYHIAVAFSYYYVINNFMWKKNRVGRGRVPSRRPSFKWTHTSYIQNQIQNKNCAIIVKTLFLSDVSIRPNLC